MNDCVATAPTPASAHVTFEPTANQCDWTATPISPVAGSRATIENVCASGPGLPATAACLRLGRRRGETGAKCDADKARPSESLTTKPRRSRPVGRAAKAGEPRIPSWFHFPCA